MSSRSPYIAHLELAAAARKRVEAVPFAPIQRKAIPAWLWLLTLAPWLVVGLEVVS